MIFQVDSWAARASFLALSRVESQFLNVGRKVLPRGEIGSGFITVKEGEWGFLSGAMWGGVMVEFGYREELGP